MDENVGLNLLLEAHGILSRNLIQKALECETDEQRRELLETFLTASNNLEKARNRIFNEGDPAVRDLITQLQDATTQLKDALEGQKKIGEVLGVLAAAVNIGKTLVSL